ncbi:MFS transporter [Streptomyces sp. NPDC088400]|uniref:MFS transporter n=1 Tax=Streptomyces sp. NPDC088400 TaxID=3365861 RepID=UPI0037F497C7
MATTVNPDVPGLDARTVRRVTLAGCIGVFVELYDNGIYGFLAVTLALVFFPEQSPQTALLLTFLTFGVPFFIRPVGGIVCGYLGDRIGRQRMLVFVILLISAATAAIGLLPDYATIGVAAPVLLILLRFAQGFSVGGEAAGAITFLAEYAPDGRRGRLTSYAQIASFSALLFGTLTAALLNAALGEDAMVSWGWRIPFLLAIPMGVIGFYIRKRIRETPHFERLRAENKLSRNPMREAFSTREHRKAVLLATLIPLLNGSGYYVLFSYMPTYLSSELHFSVVQGLIVTACSLVAITIAIPYAGRLSDRLGRRTVIAGSALIMAVLGYPSYLLLTQGSLALAILGGALMAVVFAGHTGVIHILLVELFPTRIRYSAYAFGYNISAALFGGSAPFLITWLIGLTHNTYIPAYYVVATALGTFFAVLSIRETAFGPLREE